MPLSVAPDDDDVTTGIFNFKFNAIKNQLMEEILLQYTQQFPGGLGECCFDPWNLILYSFKDFGLKSDLFQLSSLKSSNIMKEKCHVCLHLSEANPFKINLKDVENDKVLQFLTTAVLHSALRKPQNFVYSDEKKLVCKDPTMVVENGLPNFGKAQSLRAEVAANIFRLEDNSPVLRIETTKSLYLSSCNLLDLCCYKLKVDKDGEYSHENNGPLHDFLDGLICYPKFDADLLKPIVLSGHDNRYAYTTVMPVGDRSYSMVKYYQMVHNYPIKNTVFPLAVANIDGKRCRYPLECLIVAPGQKGKEEYIKPQRVDLFAEANTVTNLAKLRELKMASKLFDTSWDEICKRAQITIDDVPIQFKAKVLTPPTMEDGTLSIVVQLPSEEFSSLKYFNSLTPEVCINC